MKKIGFILIVFVVSLITYHILSPTIAHHITKSYDKDFNNKRLNIGLHPISNETSYDSITYSGNDDSKDFGFRFGNEKSFSKRWVLPTADRAHHKHKLIGYSMSYWFWENKIQYEIDTYENPLSKLENEKLMIIYDYEKNEYYARLDTVKTELAKTLNTNRIDSIYKYANDNNLILCGTAMLELEMDDFNIKEIDTIGLSKNEVDLLLDKWNIK